MSCHQSQAIEFYFIFGMKRNFYLEIRKKLDWEKFTKN